MKPGDEPPHCRGMKLSIGCPTLCIESEEEIFLFCFLDVVIKNIIVNKAKRG